MGIVLLVKRASYTYAVLIIDIMHTIVSLQCVLCTFDISVLHQVSQVGRIEPIEDIQMMSSTGFKRVNLLNVPSRALLIFLGMQDRPSKLNYSA